ncbi:MAG: alpha/beta fold hydrolase [Anaerolineae bacterium]|nr:MAG: alpha/beta fold hydrolase [Anaerolineae bacterium]
MPTIRTEEGSIQVGSASLHYEATGAGPAVILVHGFSLDLRMWDSQFHLLSKEYRTIRYDSRGFGKSSLPTNVPYTHAEDLATLLRSVSITKARVVGHSMGGQVVLEAAIRYPELVERVVLIDPWLVDFDFSPEWRALWSQIAERGGRADIAGAKDLWWRSSGLFPVASVKAGIEVKRMVEEYSGWYFANMPHKFVTPISDRLGEVSVPVLIIVGERDIPDFHAIADLLSDAIPNAHKVVIPNVGHMANMEAPTQVNAAIAEFLERGRRTGPG